MRRPRFVRWRGTKRLWAASIQMQAKRAPTGRPHRMSLAKMLGGFAIAAGCCVAGVAPAHADPDAEAAGPNPFGTLRCGCPQTESPVSAERRNEIDRGIREGLSARVPGLPPPRQ